MVSACAITGVRTMVVVSLLWNVDLGEVGPHVDLGEVGPFVGELGPLVAEGRSRLCTIP